MTTNRVPSRSGPLALIILDGYADNPNARGNAVRAAKKPTLDRLFATCPWTELITFGERVGLPDDQMGNSEVGHLNIGAGRVVEQELTRINRAVRTGKLAENENFRRALDLARERGRALHIIGLVSNGGVHSSLGHIEAFVDAAHSAGVAHTYVHAITDGRDRPPTASLEEVAGFDERLKRFVGADGKRTVSVSTVIGRYYAMDRDKRWERTKLGYDLFTRGVGTSSPTVRDALETQIAAGKTDEFLDATVITTPDTGRSQFISDGDVVLLANFRADRMRQIVRTFFGPEHAFDGFVREATPKLSGLFTLTEYEEGLPVEVVYKPFLVQEHFGWVVAKAGLKQVRIAETEKYAHVTYFFSGGNEDILPGEERLLVASPKDVPTYDLKPEMSAAGVTDRLIEHLRAHPTDVVILNYANCDMVGHTGSFEAAVKAVEAVDANLGRLLAVLESLGGRAIITADHGNADQMVDYETGGVHTFHTKHPVPLIVWNAGPLELKRGGSLCDIAPTACELLGIEPSSLMTGESLIGAGEIARNKER